MKRACIPATIDAPSPLLYTQEKTGEVDDMANEEHVKIIRQGIAVWNEWRKKYPEVRPDLRDENFNGLTLMEPTLTEPDSMERGSTIPRSEGHTSMMPI
jgi:hypothetical protein